jgi:hypothetical protein
MTSTDSFPALVARSSSTPAMRMWSSSSSTDRSRPSKECRPHVCSSASFTSHTSRSVSCRERRIWHSSNIQLKLMECILYILQFLNAIFPWLFDKQNHLITERTEDNWIFSTKTSVLIPLVWAYLFFKMDQTYKCMYECMMIWIPLGSYFCCDGCYNQFNSGR